MIFRYECLINFYRIIFCIIKILSYVRNLPAYFRFGGTQVSIFIRFLRILLINYQIIRTLPRRFRIFKLIYADCGAIFV